MIGTVYVTMNTLSDADIRRIVMVFDVATVEEFKQRAQQAWPGCRVEFGPIGASWKGAA